MKRSRTQWHLQALLLTLTLTLLLTACGGSSSATPAASNTPAPASASNAPLPASPQPKKVLKIGYLNVMDDAQAMLAKDAGLYEKYGLDVELVLFESGTDLIKGIVGGQLQGGVLGFTNAVTWAEKGADLKVVGGAQMGYHSILVRKDSNIKTIADLKGKKLASQKQGSTADIVLNGVTFKQAGLARKDLQMVYVEPAVAIQSLAAGQVDAAFVFEPYESISRATTETNPIYEIGKVWPFPCMVVITSGQQLQSDRDAINRLLDAQKEAMDLMQKQPEKAAGLLVKRFVAEEQLTGPKGDIPSVKIVQQAIASQMFHWSITPEEIKRMDEIVDIMLDQGLLKAKVDVSKILDLTWQQGKK